MHLSFYQFYGFFVDNFPAWTTILLGIPLGLAWSFACLWFAAQKKQRGMKTGYTRKIFHFLTFTTVAALHWLVGTSAVLVFGAMSSLVVFYAVWRGEGNEFYEALAREKDAPHRTYFILLPWLTTMLGGVLSNVLFGPAVIAGYLVAGLGDAIGEPAGTRFGKHSYKVWSRSSVPAVRTLEGSLAVFVVSALAVTFAEAVTPELMTGTYWGLKVMAIAVASALVEAISPHGWDNLSMQVIPAGLVMVWMT